MIHQIIKVEFKFFLNCVLKLKLLPNSRNYDPQLHLTCYLLATAEYSGSIENSEFLIFFPELIII
jgi:hypothetical protein